MMSTYLLLGTHDFRVGGGATVQVPELPPPTTGTDPHPAEVKEGAASATGTDQGGAGKEDRTEREKERENFTLLGHGEDDEYTVAQQFRDQQEAAKAAAKAVHVEVDHLSLADLMTTHASKIHHLVGHVKTRGSLDKEDFQD